MPDRGQSALNFINTLGCDIGILASFDSGLTLGAGEKQVFNVSSSNVTTYDMYLVATPECWDVELDDPTLVASVEATEYRVETMIVGVADKCLRLFVAEPDDFKKSLSGRPKLRYSPHCNSKTTSIESIDDSAGRSNSSAAACR